MSWRYRNMKSGILIRKFQLTFQEKYLFGEFFICAYCTVQWAPLLMEVWKCGRGEVNVGHFLLRMRSFHLRDAIWRHEYKSLVIFEKLKAETESQSQAEQTDFQAFIAIRRNSWLVPRAEMQWLCFDLEKGSFAFALGKQRFLRSVLISSVVEITRGAFPPKASLSPFLSNKTHFIHLLSSSFSSHGLWATVDGATKYPMKSHWDFGGRGGFANDTLSLLIPPSVSFLPV